MQATEISASYPSECRICVPQTLPPANEGGTAQNLGRLAHGEFEALGTLDLDSHAYRTGASGA